MLSLVIKKRICLLIAAALPLLISSKLWYFNFNFEEFEKQRALWNTTDFSDYSYEYFSAEFAFYYVAVQVKDGKYLSSKPLAGKNGLFSGKEEYPYTIDDIYREIANEAYSLKKHGWKWSYRQGFSCRGIWIEYDDTYHFPRKVYYEYHIPKNLHVDGNFNYEIRNFSLLL